jgi:tetratricopeptide (TPR) repeat protein
MRRFQLPWSRFPDLGAVEPRRPSRSYWRVIVVTAAVVLVVVVGAAVWLAPKFERALAEKSLRQAQEMLRLQDYRRAQLMLEQAVQSNPGDVEARRQLARFYGDMNSPRALPFWRELVRMTPGDDTNEIGLALCALRLGDLPTAREAAAGVTAAGRTTVEYHRLSAGIALRAGNQEVLNSEIAELATLEPDNARAQFNHAAIELASGQAGVEAEARKELVALARGKPLRIRATLELIRHAARTGLPFPTLAEEILPPRSEPSFVAWAMPPRGFFDLIVYMQGQPNPEPEDAALLADWLRRQGLASEAAFWLGTLDQATQDDPELLSVRASCLVQTHDWVGLAAALRQGAWGRIPEDIVNLAMAARLQRERRHLDHARATWVDALDLSGANFEALKALLRLSEELTWNEETEATLQRILKYNPRTTAAWEALAAIASGAGATEKLLEIDTAWIKAEPEQPGPRAEQAWLSALLGRSAPPGAGDPAAMADPAFMTARALALHLQNHDDEAREVLAGLPATARDDRHVALVRGLVLADRRQWGDSDRALSLATAGPLLPEESALVQAAQALNRHQ